MKFLPTGKLHATHSSEFKNYNMAFSFIPSLVHSCIHYFSQLVLDKDALVELSSSTKTISVIRFEFH